MKDAPSSAVVQLEKTQKQFIWKNENPKLKHNTLCKEFEQGGLKNMDIFAKITTPQCYWVKRLYNDSFDVLKLTLYFLSKIT